MIVRWFINQSQLLFLSLGILGCLLTCGCSDSTHDYITFVLDEGTARFALELSKDYKVDRVNPGNDTGDPSEDFMAVTFVNKTKESTIIQIFGNKPSELIPNAQAAIERTETNASSWDDYQLIEKTELTINGVKAYRIDYKHNNIIPAIVGTSKPSLSIYREVNFDADGLRWMILMESDSSTAEEDKADFEHILETLKILD